MSHSLLDDFENEFFPNLKVRNRVFPRIDLIENQNAYELKMDLPGIHQKEVEIGVKEHVLTISGKRGEEKNEDNENVLFSERWEGNFSRSFDLANKIDENQIEAKFDNGLLVISLPKKTEIQPRIINIKK